MARIANLEAEKRQETWRDDYPWLLLLKTFRISIGWQLLSVAGLAAVLTSAGWRLSSSCFGTDSGVLAETVAADREYLSKWPGQRTTPGLPNTVFVPEAVREPLSTTFGSAPSNPVVALPVRAALPLLRVFNRDLTWGQFFYYLVGGFWTLLIWSTVGMAMARIAVVQMGREDRIELVSAVRFAGNKFPSMIGALLMPILGIGMLTVPIAVLGLLMRLGIGALLAGLLWPLVIVTTGMMATILLGLLVGWPLVSVAIATEGSDAFDGISRSYAYAFQRPLRYLAYCLVAAILGTLGWLLVWGFSETIINLGYWSATWGLGHAQVARIASGAELSGLSWAGAALIRFWGAVIRTLASGYGYSFFWCAMAGIYLLLRQAVDATEWDQVYDDRQLVGGIVYGLPQLDASAATSGGEKTTVSSGSA